MTEQRLIGNLKLNRLPLLLLLAGAVLMLPGFGQAQQFEELKAKAEKGDAEAQNTLASISTVMGKANTRG